MALDRDETILRCYVALVQSGRSIGAVDDAVEMADALLARLRPEAVAPAPSRPEWVPKVGDRVRVTRDKADYADVECGDEFVVSRIVRDDGAVSRQLVYGLPSGEFIRVENLEPCAAPGAAPSPAAIVGEAGTVAGLTSDPQPEWVRPPAASPAPYVPRVGDVVSVMAGDGWTGTVVEPPDSKGRYIVHYHNGGDRAGAHTRPPHLRYLRPATSSERAAAGLPVDEAKESATKPVDREGLAGAIWRSFNDESPDRRFDTIGVYERESYIRAADAAIEFMAKGGAS